MRVLVTGSRDWENRDIIYRALNEVCEEFELNYPPDEYGNTLPDPARLTVVHGDCPTGADAIADDWCTGNALIEPERHPAQWRALGRSAGPLRNQHMVDLGADLCLAFIRANSRGASGTVRLAEAAGIPVRIHREP